MAEFFEPIAIRYEGRDAKNNQIDLAQFGQSLQGASRLLAVSGNIVFTRKFVSRTPAMSVRVFAQTIQPGSFDIAVLIAPFIPVLPHVLSGTGTRAVEALVNWTLAKLGGRKSEVDRLANMFEKAIGEQGDTSREAIEAVRSVAEKAIESQRPAARQFVTPIGESCEVAMLGQQDETGITIDQPTKDAIAGPGDIEVLDERGYNVLLTELDLRNRTCKVSIEGEEQASRRYNAVVTDPILPNPNNPYAVAMAKGQWITVRGKMQLVDGDPYKLYISDTTS